MRVCIYYSNIGKLYREKSHLENLLDNFEQSRTSIRGILIASHAVFRSYSARPHWLYTHLYNRLYNAQRTRLSRTNHTLFPLQRPIHQPFLTTDLSIRSALRHWPWVSTWGVWHTYVKRLADPSANHSAFLAFPHFLHANTPRLANRSVVWEVFEFRSCCELGRSRAAVWESVRRWSVSNWRCDLTGILGRYYFI